MQQDKLNALRIAGKMLAPILEAERGDSCHAIHIQATAGGFRVAQVQSTPLTDVIAAEAETLDQAFVRFLAARSDKLRANREEAEDRAAFEAFRAEQKRIAA